jgi:5'-nucleotidase-like protein
MRRCFLPAFLLFSSLSYAARTEFRDAGDDDVIGRAMIEATGADVALIPTLADVKGNLADRIPSGASIETTTVTATQIRALLERAAGRFETYDFKPNHDVPATADSMIDKVHGLSYELDLTRAPGERVVNLIFRGDSLARSRVLKVAVTQARASRGDPELASARPAIGLRDAVAASLLRARGPHRDFQPALTVLPDYAGSAERPLIDRLVREAAFPREEVMRLYPDDHAQRGDLAYWLARAFGWRERKLSGAWSDLPDSLEAWIDGLARRHVLDTDTRTSEQFQPYAAATLPTALAWCIRAARAAYRGLPPDSTLARDLVANTSLASRQAAADTLTRAQALGIVANARFLSRK